MFLRAFPRRWNSCDPRVSWHPVFSGLAVAEPPLPGKKIVFVTNNSTKSREEYLKKFTGLGIPSNVEEIFGSAYSSAIYISRILKLSPPKNKVFVIGEAGIEHELRSENVPFI